ncbi:FGGY-family carbohydrate kinase [Paenibacillus cremeus]|uniref:Carbohydrate kinase FGGY C-terminal domain-containing protein n=1 Tax=Paenibacillus cremeus TaxID=2163881 RepID=A0A559K8F0_9BACL|nr:FGGY-family carbohydrate kinase [Paenibacillus cremeus]TVY08398.1 hypothetical protein FPZ49_19360 [Paenibacillus cremeus]
MGTAETMMGFLSEKKLTDKELNSGLSYGLHVVEGQYYWLGGLSASGGSVEWLRSVLGEEPVSYEDMSQLVRQAGQRPTGILYFPYLVGSGAPWPDANIRGALIGLDRQHGRAEIAKAVLEGTAYQMEAIREAAELANGTQPRSVISVGGGTRNMDWMQIKSDVSNCTFAISSVSEAALVGAARLAAMGCGFVLGGPHSFPKMQAHEEKIIVPSVVRHAEYHRIYETQFKPLRSVLSTNRRPLG